MKYGTAHQKQCVYIVKYHCFLELVSCFTNGLYRDANYSIVIQPIREIRHHTSNTMHFESKNHYLLELVSCFTKGVYRDVKYSIAPGSHANCFDELIRQIQKKNISD